MKVTYTRNRLAGEKLPRTGRERALAGSTVAHQLRRTPSEGGEPGSAQVLTALCDEVLEGLDDFSLENQERVVHEWIEQKGLKLGSVMNAWRLALVGEGKGPGMFDISAFLGKEETLARMKRAIEVLG